MANDIFFYADDEPELYDRAVPLTDRSYETGHDALQYCLGAWVKTQSTAGEFGSKVLNLGCGTGKEALRLLDTISNCHVVAVDNSHRMLSALRRKALVDFGEDVLGRRVSIVLSDYTEVGWFERDPVTSCAPFDIVVAAHSLHHLSGQAKKRLYGEVGMLLRPGGVLAILDLFDFDQEWLSTLGKTNIAQWLEGQMASGSIAANHAGLYPLSRRRELSKAWLDHLDRENVPLPINRRIPPSSSNLMHSEEVLLSSNGFHEIEIPFRWFQSGLVISTKRH